MGKSHSIGTVYPTLQDIVRYGTVRDIRSAMSYINIPYDVDEVYTAAVQRGLDDVIEWAKTNGAKVVHLPTEIVGIIAPYMGYVPRIARAWLSDIVEYDTLDALINKYKNLETIISKGTKDQVEFAMNYVNVIPYKPIRVAYIAARRGYIKIVEHMDIGTSEYWDNALYGAIHGGYLHIVKYIICKCKLHLPDMARTAAEYGHLDIVKYAVGMGARNWDEIACVAYTNGNKDILDYVIKKGASIHRILGRDI